MSDPLPLCPHVHCQAYWEEVLLTASPQARATWSVAQPWHTRCALPSPTRPLEERYDAQGAWYLTLLRYRLAHSQKRGRDVLPQLIEALEWCLTHRDLLVLQYLVTHCHLPWSLWVDEEARPLVRMVQEGQVDLLRYLLSHPTALPPHVWQAQNPRLLALACQTRRYEVVALLLRRGPYPLYAVLDRGGALVNQAILQGDTTLLALFFHSVPALRGHLYDFTYRSLCWRLSFPRCQPACAWLLQQWHQDEVEKTGTS